MRLYALSTGLLLIAVAFLAVAPTADARGVCSNTIDGDDCPSTVCTVKPGGGSRGWWLCIPPPVVCVRDPCPGGPEQ